MRLLVRKVYRAFPELDSYSDEQCSRFVHAAKRGIWRKLFRYGLLGTALVLIMLAVLFLSAMAAMAAPFPPKSPFWWYESVGVLVLIAMGIPSLALVWYFRDWMLRRRIGFVLRSRGRCGGCGYSLIGLPVSANATVVCPECGFDCKVDEAIGELTIDEAGRRRFTPGNTVVTRLSRRAQRDVLRRRRNIGRVLRRTGIALALCVMTLGVCLGVHEWRIRAQAEVAEANRPSSSVFVALYRSTSSGNDVIGETALDRLLAASANADRLEAAFMTKLDLSVIAALGNGGVAFRVGSSSTEGLRSIADPSSALAWSVRVIDDLAGRGVNADLDAIENAPHRLVNHIVLPGIPLWRTPAPELGPLQSMNDRGFARLRLAVARNDPREFVAALRAYRAVVRTALDVPSYYSFDVSRAAPIGAARVAIVGLSSQPSREWVEAVSTDWWSEPDSPTRDMTLEWWRLYLLDSLCFSFTDVSAVRVFPMSFARDEWRVAALSARWSIGTLEENRTALETLIANSKAALAVDPFARLPLTSGSSRPLVEAFRRQLTFEGELWDYAAVMKRGLITLLAIEKYRLATGTLPSALSDLVPSQISALPLDPWTGKPFCYKRVDPTTEVQKRSFILYSVGKDGIDNGGLDAPIRTYSGLYDAPGHDIIINTTVE